MRFDDVKSDTLNLRVSPAFKLALKAAAEHDQRSMVNMLEVLLAAHCDAKGIIVPQRRADPLPDRRASSSESSRLSKHSS